MLRALMIRCRKFSLLLPLLLADAGCATRLQESVPLQRFEFTQPQMGLPFRIVLYTADQASANSAARAAFARISQLNDILSDYDTDSELSLLSRTQAGAVPCP